MVGFICEYDFILLYIVGTYNIYISNTQLAHMCAYDTEKKHTHTHSHTKNRNASQECSI